MSPQWKKTKANKRRAENGLTLATIASERNDGLVETEENLVDAVTDVLHYAASRGIESLNILRRSEEYFNTECTGRNT